MSRIHIFDLPNEILYKILAYTIKACVWLDEDEPFANDSLSIIARALRLRLVCKHVDALFQPVLFETQVMDFAGFCRGVPGSPVWPILKSWPIRRNQSAPLLWHSYFVYRVCHETDSSILRYVEVRQIAESIQKMSNINMNLEQIINALCWLILQNPEGRVDRHMLGFGHPEPPKADPSLSAAAFLNCIPLARKLLEEGNDPTHYDGLFPAAVEVAAWAGNTEMLQLLQENLPDEVHLAPEYYYGFLHHPSLDFIRCKGKADPQALVGAVYRDDFSILELALYPPSRTNLESTEYFGQQYGNMDPTSKAGCHIRDLMEHAKSWAMYKKLASIFSRNFFEEHIKISARHLHVYAEYGNLEIVRGLLDAGVSAQGDNQSGLPSPLHLAARRGFEDIVDLLLERGVDVNLWVLHFEMPLYAAVDGGFIRLACKLLARGAFCTFRALCRAMDTYNVSMARMLIEVYPPELNYDLWCFRSLLSTASETGMTELLSRLPGVWFKDGEIQPPIGPIRPGAARLVDGYFSPKDTSGA